MIRFLILVPLLFSLTVITAKYSAAELKPGDPAPPFSVRVANPYRNSKLLISQLA